MTVRVVLDANIFISSLISELGNPAKIINRWLEEEFEVLISPPIIDEILRVTAYERLQKKYAKVHENRLEFAALISKQATWIEPQKKLDVVPDDESDNRYFECAAAGNAQHIISDDEHLLQVGEYQGITVLTPAAFLALLDSGMT